jgi:protein O-mannosyl-transferase
VGWFWFLGILVPMIGLVQVGEQAMADRFEYIPMIGVLIALVWGGYELVRENKLSRNVAVATSCVAVAVLGGLTYHQLGYWKDGETLFRYTLSITEKNYMAYQALGMALENQGRVGEAIAEFQAAEALHDFPASQVLELGIYEQRNGHVQEAISLYTKVLRKSTDLQMRAKAWDQMGSANIELKNFDVAKQAYQNALQIRTDDAAALLGSGLLAERSGETSQAVEQLSLSAKLEPSDVRLLLLARALRRDRRPQEAQAAEELATKISPDLSQAEAKASQIMVLFGFAPSANLE